MIRSVFFALLLAPALSFAAQGTMYVQSKMAKLLSEPAFKATALATLKKGTEVKVLKNEGRWVEVSSGEQQGWISKFLLADHPPLEKVTVLTGAKESKLEDNARRRASAITTAGATRGLADEGRLRESDSVSVNYGALEQMETKTVSEKEARSFLDEGMNQ